MPVTVTSEERKVLETLAVSRTAPYRQVQRARTVLAAVAGKTNEAISQETGLSGWLGWRTGLAQASLGNTLMRTGCGSSRQPALKSPRPKVIGACEHLPRPLEWDGTPSTTSCVRPT